MCCTHDAGRLRAWLLPEPDRLAIPNDKRRRALKELLRKKQKGERIERPQELSRANVVNLMDALRQSVKVETGSTARRRISGSGGGRASKKPSRSAARHRKAG
jgi:non-homologous end joining protein Ku